MTAAGERERVRSPSTQQDIETAAALIANEVWAPILAELRSKYPLIVTPEYGRPKSKLVGKAAHPPVRRNHYSPASSHSAWARNGDRKVREYSRGPNGVIRSRDIGYRSWGYEELLYSQRLEAYLGLVDQDGADTCRKILRTEPLDNLDKRRWIAFLVIQQIRTPSFMRRLISQLSNGMPSIAPGYPTTVAALKAAYETLFTNNNYYAENHVLMASRSWTVLSAPAGSSFIRADNPVVAGRSSDGGWTLYYPMSPTRMFRIGPEQVSGYEQDFVPSVQLSRAEVRAVNIRSARNARRSVIATIEREDTELRDLLQQWMLPISSQDDDDLSGIPMWGPLTRD